METKRQAALGRVDLGSPDCQVGAEPSGTIPSPGFHLLTCHSPEKLPPTQMGPNPSPMAMGGDEEN